MSALYYESSFAHHGIKGQKWGLRRYQNTDGTLTALGRRHYLDYSDRRTGRKLRRGVSATGKHYRKTLADTKELENEYEKESKAYTKAAGEIAFTRGQKERLAAELDERRESLSDTGDLLRNKRADLEDARHFYDSQVQKYKKYSDDILSKYGNDKIVDLPMKDYKIGRDFVETMAKTGLTFTDFPVFGPSYANRFVAKLEAKRRKENIEERAKEESEMRY